MARFPDTQWSLIRRSAESPSVRHSAFSQLVQAYRPAIVAFFRARLPSADADDAVQSFLAASFEYEWWNRADAGIGSFRGFLLMLMHRHLGHVRAGHAPHLALDEVAEPSDPAPSPERAFDTRFALLLTRRALDALRTQYRERGRDGLFDQLLPLVGDPPDHGALKQAAEAMNVNPNTLTVELKRLRMRLRAALSEELRQLCVDQAAFEADRAALHAVLGAL